MDLRGNIKLEGIQFLNYLNIDHKEKEIVREWRNNMDIRRWMYSDHVISEEEHAMFIEGLKIDNKNSYWLARDENEGYLGVISLNRIDSANKNAYLGIYTNPYSGKTGTGYVLIECLKRLAFHIVYLHTLKLEVIENNEKAIRFYEKSGFSEEGRLREFVFKDGKWCDVIVMGIIKRNVGQTWKSE